MRHEVGHGDRSRRPVVRTALRVATLALLGLAAAGGCGDRHQGADRIVLVTIDTLRADRVGAYGDLSARTPVLDSLARQGVRFSQAIAPTPLTLPSHTSLMTGRQPPRHGVRHNSVFIVDPGLPLLAERMQATGHATAAFVGAFVLDSRFGLARGFDVYDDDVGARRASKNPFSYSERPADAVVDAALEWLARAPDRFFLWVHLYDPHADYEPPPRFLRRASGDGYAGEIAFADAQVGRLLRRIGERWGRDGLVVAVTSDHGESLGEHSERTHSYTVYDATQRVPLILVGGGLPAGRVVDTPVRLVDVAPTLLWFAGAEPIAEADGRSLVRLLHADEPEERVAYVETLATQLDMGWSPLLGVRTSRHKYIRAPQPELYDLEVDPEETRNLALTRPETARELDEVLERQLEGALPAKASLELADEDRARLESLGYVVPDAASLEGELGVVGGLNPRDLMLEAARMQDARSALAEGRPRRALELLEAVQSPGSVVAQTRAHAALGAGRPERAIETMEALRERGHASASDLTLLGMAYLAAERLPEARRTLESARELGPEEHGPLRGLAILAQREGDLETAERRFVEAEALSQRPQEIRVDRAALLLEQGRQEEAERLLAEVDDPVLEEPPTALRLARALDGAGQAERAADLLRRALAGRPGHAMLRATLASILEADGRLDEAVAIWERAHADDPDDPSARNDLAWGLAVAGRDLDRALRLARGAAEALPGEPAVLDTLATVHLVRGEAGPALRAADQALAGDAGTLGPHLLYVRAAALAALGREAEARDALRSLDGRAAGLQPPWRERALALSRRLGVAVDEAAAAGRP